MHTWILAAIFMEWEFVLFFSSGMISTSVFIYQDVRNEQFLFRVIRKNYLPKNFFDFSFLKTLQTNKNIVPPLRILNLYFSLVALYKSYNLDIKDPRRRPFWSRYLGFKEKWAKSCLANLAPKSNISTWKRQNLFINEENRV